MREVGGGEAGGVEGREALEVPKWVHKSSTPNAIFFNFLITCPHNQHRSGRCPVSWGVIWSSSPTRMQRPHDGQISGSRAWR